MSVLDQFEHKTLVTQPYGLTYSYYLSPNFHTTLNPSVPTVMLVHGFPDAASMWSGALPQLLKLPYPILLPDILGLGGSTKATDAKMYNYKQQADSLAQIMDHEGVPDNIIPIGHDWGSGVSQRFYLYHRKRCIGLSLLSLAYQVPSSEVFNLDEANKQTAERFGYPQWEYWNFFTNPQAPQIISENLPRFYEAMHGNHTSPDKADAGRDIWMREIFCTPNAMHDYMTSNGKYSSTTADLKPYARDTRLRDFLQTRWKNETLVGAVNYYVALKNNTNLEDERTLCPETSRDQKDHRKITVPLLYIGCTGDWVCRTDLMGDAKKAGLLDEAELEEKVVQSGHWVLYEKPDEIAEILSEWLTRKFPVK